MTYQHYSPEFKAKIVLQVLQGEKELGEVAKEHNINPKTYYNWQKKVFAAMVEQQQLQLEAPQESKPRFAELQPPAVQNNLVAAVRIGEVSLDVYSGASAEVVTALCKALRNVK